MLNFSYASFVSSASGISNNVQVSWGILSLFLSFIGFVSNFLHGRKNVPMFIANQQGRSHFMGKQPEFSTIVHLRSFKVDSLCIVSRINNIVDYQLHSFLYK